MSPSKSPSHVCHYKSITEKKFFTCYGCKMSGFGTRFNCECGHELHRECKNRKPCINHEYFGSSTLTFLKKPFTELRKGKSKYSKFCDACGKDIRGYSYHCEKDKLDLHPCCANLEKKLLIDGTVLNLVPKVSKKCKWCHKTEISIGDYKVSGWSYVSNCDQQYNFHVYCMREMLHEARLKHGDSALEKVDIKQLAKTKRNGGSKWTTFGRILKSVLSIIASVLLGDPTILIANAVVDLLTGG